MKLKSKLLSTLLALLLALGVSASFVGCGSSDDGNAPISEDVTSSEKVDNDYALYTPQLLFDTIPKFSTSSDYVGETVKLRVNYGAVFDFSENSFVSVIEQTDPNPQSCCPTVYYPVRFADGAQRPALGSKIELVGEFCDGYIQVSKITLYSGSFESNVPQIDTTKMSASEIKSFVTTAGKLNNEYVGQTVRICGHYSKSADGFSFLLGFEGDNSSASRTWSIEIHSENVDFPEITDNYIHAYEIIGTVSSYKTADGNEWPCIEVQSIRLVNNFSV